MRMKSVLLLCCLSISALFAAEPYRKPSQAVLDVLEAPPLPTLTLSPAHTLAFETRAIRYPSIAEVSEPMLRLAGLRINPKTNGLHNANFASSLKLRKIPEGTEIAVTLPPNPRLSAVRFSPDGTRFLFTNATAAGIELWVGDSATGKAHRVEGVRLNAVLGLGGNFLARTPAEWLPDGKTILVLAVKSGRGAPPAEPTVPTGPHVQESLGGAAPVPTYQDMLQNPHDEDLFEFYATGQLATVDYASGKVTPAGKPGMIMSARVSPDGQYFLVFVMHRPFSYVHDAGAFPREIEVWDRTGKVVHKVASLPLEDHVPINGVPTGPRSVEWRPSAPASLIWAEALDGGDLKNQVPHRDRLMTMAAPFTGQPRELFQIEQRFSGIQMAARGGLALVEDFERRTRRVRTFQADLDNPSTPLRLIWNRNNQDRYRDPGSPVEKRMPNGQMAMIEDNGSIFLTGTGASPTGDHPFLDRFNLAEQRAERLFHCDDDHYEVVAGLLDEKGSSFLTRRESPTEPPNYFIHKGSQATALTKYADPQPSIRGIHKEMVRYKRADGIDLSFTLYLPPDYKQGTRLPTVVWAYPYEYNDADTAGQVTGSTKRFTEMTGYSQLFFVLNGYAVLDSAAMPVVGSDPDVVNNTYIDQIVSDAKAAIDKAVEMGVTDRNRVGVGGHSYGGFMTANLLAHCDLFKGGIAESAAHNRTLTPFGFQSERRTLWQAPDVYLKMSPFMFADKIKTPMLLIHGEMDDNTGTFPIQSQRMYEAVRGNGGTVRLVFLPFEAHGYRARETVEHVLWEKFAWFDKYVKGAAAPAGTR